MKLSILYEGFNLWNGQPRYNNDKSLHDIMCYYRDDLNKIIDNPQHSRVSNLRNIISSTFNDIDDIIIDSDEDRELINFVCDKFASYKSAFSRLFYRIANLSFGVPIACKKYGLEHNNNPIERYNGKTKDRIKNIRGGFGSFQGADQCRKQFLFDVVEYPGHRPCSFECCSPYQMQRQPSKNRTVVLACYVNNGLIVVCSRAAHLPQPHPRRARPQGGGRWRCSSRNLPQPGFGLRR